MQIVNTIWNFISHGKVSQCHSNCANVWLISMACFFLLKILMVLFVDRSVWAATVPGGGPLLGEAVVDQATVWAVLSRTGGTNDWPCLQGHVEDGQTRCPWSGRQHGSFMYHLPKDTGLRKLRFGDIKVSKRRINFKVILVLYKFDFISLFLVHYKKSSGKSLRTLYVLVV